MGTFRSTRGKADTCDKTRCTVPHMHMLYVKNIITMDRTRLCFNPSSVVPSLADIDWTLPRSCSPAFPRPRLAHCTRLRLAFLFFPSGVLLVVPEPGVGLPLPSSSSSMTAVSCVSCEMTGFLSNAPVLRSHLLSAQSSCIDLANTPLPDLMVTPGRDTF